MEQPTTNRRSVVGVVLGLALVLTVLLVAFAWPASRLAPRHLPVAVVGQPEVLAQIDAGLSRAAGKDAFDLTTLGSRTEAVRAIEGRDVYGALVLSRDGTEVVTASAASPAVAQLLTEVGSRVAASSGSAVHTTDLVPPPTADPRGAVFAAGSFPLVVGGIATGVLISLRVAGRGRRVVAAVGVAVAAGLALAGIEQVWFDALGGSYLANAGVYALAIGAMACLVAGLHNLARLPGLVLGAATVLLLGNPLSGITSAPELLPTGWGTLGQLLPPGAAGTALRSTAFFDGAGAGGPLLVLAGWVVVGLVTTLVPTGRRLHDPAVRRTPVETELQDVVRA